MYGMSVNTLQGKLQIPKDQMMEIVELWWKTYPSVKRFIDQKYLDGFRNGYITSIKGKRLYLPELLFMKDRTFNKSIVGSHLRESAINYMNSGTAADWFKLSLDLLDNRFTENNLDVHIVNTLHDEIVFEVRKEQIDSAVEIINSVMREEALNSEGINVKSSVDICKWWDECNEDEKDTIMSESSLIDLNNDRFMCRPTIDRYKRKYLKYKMKYLKLKNKLNNF